MPILTNVTAFAIYDLSNNSYSIENVKEVSWEDSDPWLKIPIPYGPLTYQQIKPCTITLKSIHLNYQSLIQALEVSGAINFSTMHRGYLSKMIITGSDSTGNVVTLTFGNNTAWAYIAGTGGIHVEILSIDKLTELVGEAHFICQWHIDAGPVV